MNLTMFESSGPRAKRAAGGLALLAVLAAAVSTAIGDVNDGALRPADRVKRELGLFAGPTAVLTGNQLQCGIDNIGNVCSNVFGSPTGGGGSWPIGTPDGYIFNSGLQIAGIMSPDAGPWAGDTVGAFFFDPKGNTVHGTQLTSIYDSRDASDLANWPADAVVSDPDLFQPVLLGRKSASQEDSWVRYWDGDPRKIAGRKHPMGIQVTQRSLAWNYPAGNESIIYFLYTFKNVTNDPNFQRLNELQFFGGDNRLPDEGIRLDSVYAAFAADMDVSNATSNYSTAVLPFNLGLSYDGTFTNPSFVFPPAIFRPPFFTNAVGLIGVKYLRSPVDPATGQQVGLTMFSATVNSSASGGTGFADPLTDTQLWRYLSGRVNPSLGDPPCNIPAETPTSRSLCFLHQTATDTRFFQASGPFALDPGQEATVVVAYIAAPTVATLPDGSPSGIDATGSDASVNPPGIPSFHPGYESDRGCDADGTNCSVVVSASSNVVKPIEKGAGWVSYSGPPPSGSLESPSNRLDQFGVKVVPGSLLGKALVAQTIFDNKFLLGFAPEPPTFYLVPGDGMVSVVWNRSATDPEPGTGAPSGGDPFYQVASDPTSALYNPNYRQFDVEGYRIYRGTDPTRLSLIAQFDYADSRFQDFTCETVGPDEDAGTRAVNQAGDTVDVQGYAAGEICAHGSDPLVRPIDNALVFNNGGAGAPPGGGVVRLNTLAATAVSLDPAVTSTNPDLPPLADTGVPFVYIDRGVPNNFTFYYAVTAFDVNSESSGPNSLESGRSAQQTVPRKDAPNLELAHFESSLTGDDGVGLDPAAPAPKIDPDAGTFAGPFPPPNGAATSFAPLVERLLPQFERTIRIDSVVPDVTDQTACNDPGLASFGISGYGFFEQCWKMYLSVGAGGSSKQTVVDGTSLPWDFGGLISGSVTLQLARSEVPFDPKALSQFGIPSGSGFATVTGTFDQSTELSSVLGYAVRRDATSRILHGGSRWFDGATETVPDPTRYVRVGHLDAVDTVWAPLPNIPTGPGGAPYPASANMEAFSVGFGWLGRAADVRFTWQDGSFGSVRDVTDHVDVPFSPNVRASWGFLNTDANGNGVLDWDDFQHVGDALGILNTQFGSVTNPGAPVELERSPTLMPVSTQGVDPTTMAQTGMGFGLYVDGETYLFQAPELPADGTVWTLRSYAGVVRTSSASVGTDDPSGYTYGAVYSAGQGVRQPMVPGLTFQFRSEQATKVAARADLSKVHTVPNPYLATSTLDLAPTEKQLMFVDLPPRATIRIYSVTGILVAVVEHDDPTGGGRAVWNLRNRNNQFVASGIYFFQVITPAGQEQVGKFSVVNFGGQN